MAVQKVTDIGKKLLPVGLTLGVDDAVVKPFGPRDLVARVKTVLRRTSPATKKGETVRFYFFVDLSVY